MVEVIIWQLKKYEEHFHFIWFHMRNERTEKMGGRKRKSKEMEKMNYETYYLIEFDNVNQVLHETYG